MTSNDADTIRILVATDSHVGYRERDPIQKDDSWKSFDEVMQLAKSQDSQVDMVLLAGDLFHENKPSRKSMYQVMRSLRKNCLGDKPCELEFLSDASDVFDGAFNHANYEDPDINIAIPVFSIHGNHDDPTGDGNFCSLDLLQVSGLCNYFGRIPESDNIQVKPVLLQKGLTKLALYGMSNVRDERLFRTFRDGNVKFFRPGVQQQDWFNLMAVHQNHHAHSDTNYLPESFLPKFLDLVIWGHEHECQIDPRLNLETKFHVMQPGSSIATSLVPSEAVAKHVAVLSITGKEFKVEKHRIRSVRPFLTKDIVLQNDTRFKRLMKLKDNRTLLTNELEKIVLQLIDEAKDEWLSIQEEEIDEKDIPLPLIRLRVEHSAPEGYNFDCENPQRFSNRFINKVANVNDVIYFHRKKKISRANVIDKNMPDASVLDIMEGDGIKVSKLVHEFLTAQSLKIIPQAEFGDSVTQFVEKGDNHAMEEFVSESLTLQVREMLALDEEEISNIDEQMEIIRTKREKLFAAGLLKKNKERRKLLPRPLNWDSDEQGEWADQPGAVIIDEDEDTTSAVVSKRAKNSLFVSDDELPIVSEPKKKTVAAKAPVKRNTTKPRAAEKAKPPARARKRAVDPFEDNNDGGLSNQTLSTRTTRRGKQTLLNLTQSQAPKKVSMELSDDEISDDAYEPDSRTTNKRR
ncbi:double-strand break repair protein mus-23 [Blumeria hordei DH14]|uniref:Double-strand break repair protein n=1 Tax=Blumeria graminis f. sp. hordei (strain DH14) TaxID=546991 RepID=N1JGI3_BLUG1|nr:double-strand break repair protein mus-23 [Blumeria hordei DH14]